MLFNTFRAQRLLLCTVHIFPLAMCPNFRTRPATANGVAGIGYFSSFTVYSPLGDGSCLFTVLGHQLGRGFAAADDLCAVLVA